MTGWHALLGAEIPIVTAATRLDFLSRRERAAGGERAAPGASFSRSDPLRGQGEPRDLQEGLAPLGL